MSQGSPTLSVGLAVRNGRDVVGRCIESVLSQDFADFELVICDNVSDDGTVALLEEYARSDPRIALHVNDVNIGSQENMKRTLELRRAPTSDGSARTTGSSPNAFRHARLRWSAAPTPSA